MDPQQELFSYFLVELRKKYPNAVYDGFLPDENASYPFVYLADSILNDDILKNAVFGNITQTIHIYHNDVYKRGTLSQMMLEVKNIARKLSHTNNFNWILNGVDQRILTDTSTQNKLMHGIINFSYKFS